MFEATDADAACRLDRFLAGRITGLSRSRIQALIKSGCVQAQSKHAQSKTSASSSSGILVDPGWRVKPGDRIMLALPEPSPAEPLAEAMPLTVVFEDAHLIVIDKPAGLVVHPAAGHATGTLVNALIAHCGDSLSGIGGVRRPGIVHRLDKDTSGLLVVAKTDAAHHGLSEQFASHGADGRMDRRYLAIAWGGLAHTRGRIDAPLTRSISNRTKITVARPQAEAKEIDDAQWGSRQMLRRQEANQAGRHAVTHWESLATFTASDGRPVASLIECRLETGRTHQIRVHLSHIGHPLLGDRTYGSHFSASARRLDEASRAALERLGRQALHAAHLAFEHPVTGRPLAYDSPLPDDMAALHSALVAGSRSNSK